MKLYKQELNQGRVIAFNNQTASYGRLPSGKYRLEIKIWGTGIAIPIYIGKKKPFFRNITIIALFAWIIPLIIWLVSPIWIFLYSYITGGYNFFTDSVWVNYVKFFHYTNITLLLILGILKIIELL